LNDFQDSDKPLYQHLSQLFRATLKFYILTPQKLIDKSYTLQSSSLSPSRRTSREVAFLFNKNTGTTYILYPIRSSEHAATLTPQKPRTRNNSTSPIHAKIDMKKQFSFNEAELHSRNLLNPVREVEERKKEDHPKLEHSSSKSKSSPGGHIKSPISINLTEPDLTTHMISSTPNNLQNVNAGNKINSVTALDGILSPKNKEPTPIRQFDLNPLNDRIKTEPDFSLTRGEEKEKKILLGSEPTKDPAGSNHIMIKGFAEKSKPLSSKNETTNKLISLQDQNMRKKSPYRGGSRDFDTQLTNKDLVSYFAISP